MFRDFFYIDDDLLRAYFTQLPAAAKLAFEKQYRVNLDLVLGLNPQLIAKRDYPQLPISTPVALALLLERHLQRHERLGSPDTLEGKFVAGDFHVLYTRIDDILFAFPRVSTVRRLAALENTFCLLGDFAKCNYGWDRRTAARSDESTLARLFSAWRDIRLHRLGDATGVDAQWTYSEFAEGREGMLGALRAVAMAEMRRSIPAQLRGICRVRTRFHSKRHELTVLYPLFLERIATDE